MSFYKRDYELEWVWVFLVRGNCDGVMQPPLDVAGIKVQ